jgi:hypothetical protein
MTNELSVCVKVCVKIAVEGDWQLMSVQRHCGSVCVPGVFCHLMWTTPHDSLVSLTVLSTWHTQKQTGMELYHGLFEECHNVDLDEFLISWEAVRNWSTNFILVQNDYSLWTLLLTLLLKWKDSMLLRKRWFLSFEEELVIRLLLYIKLVYAVIWQWYKASCPACVRAGIDPCFLVLKLIHFLGLSLQKRIQSYQ